MTTWAKNQILKQLTKFAKNLDPSSISLKFFKGEGELENLELDERVLSELLEFPPWLQLTKVTSKKITAKVPWTSLKSDPIRLKLDYVEVHIVASETAREKVENLPIFTNNSNKPTKYGFVERVLDGICISIDTVMVLFTSRGFKASVTVSGILVQSTTPDWHRTNSLKQTRIKDEAKGEVLTFKEIEWTSMRIDADAAYTPESVDIPSIPIRLIITNKSVIRLVIKKRLSDCAMIASKLAVILDDIIWVLTRSQILKLSSFMHYLIQLRRKFLPISHQSVPNNPDPTLPQQQQQAQPNAQVQNLFSAYDLPETSIHLRTHRIDLNLYDDITVVNDAKDDYSGMFDESGAGLQVSLINIALDHCPYHVAGTKRSAVRIDDQLTYQRQKWSHQIMTNFHESEGKKTPMRRQQQISERERLYESFFVVTCSNFLVMQVKTRGEDKLQPFLSSEKESLFLPKEMTSIYLDHTSFYYPHKPEEPVPAPNVFVSVNPIQLTFHPLTCVWLNRFAQSVIAGLEWTKEFISNEVGFSEHVNIRVEALMPKIRIPSCEKEHAHHADERPKLMEIQISQAVISNCRVGDKCTQTDILSDLQMHIAQHHYTDMSCFPNRETDLPPHSNTVWLNDHSINYYRLNQLIKRDRNKYQHLKQNNQLPKQIWCIWLDQIWLEFVGIQKAGDRPVSFVEAFPLRIWFSQDVPYNDVQTVKSDEIACLDTNTKIKNMNVVYDVETGPVVNYTASATSSPRGNPRMQKHNKSSFYIQDYSSEDVQSLRTSHSDGDIINAASRHEHSENNTNYARGGPPPPSLNPIPFDLKESEDKSDGSTCDEEPSGSQVLEVLVSTQKAVQVQLDHFQLLYLLRVGELFSAMATRIGVDKEKAEKESDFNQIFASSETQQECVVLNMAIANILIDIILPPCIGIDPLQSLSFSDRLLHEQKKTAECSSDITPTVLPIRTPDPPDPVDNQQHFSRELRSSASSKPINSQVGIIENSENDEKPVFSSFKQSSGGLGEISALEVNSSEESCRVSSAESCEEEYNEHDEYHCEEDYRPPRTQDAEVQVGSALLSFPLKPTPENQLISILRITLNSIHVGIQAVGEESVVKVAAEQLHLKELGNLKYGRLLDHRRNLVEMKNLEECAPKNCGGEYALTLRINPPSVGSELCDMEIYVKSLIADLLMSTVDNLSEFAEDEFIVPVTPFVVHLTDARLTMYDDKPRRYASAIKLPPVQVLLVEMHISRNVEGVILINKSTSGQETVTDAKDSNLNESSAEEISRTNENHRLLQDLRVVNAKVNDLNLERESLIKVIDKLNQELMHSNRENDSLHHRVRAMSVSASNRGHYV